MISVVLDAFFVGMANDEREGWQDPADEIVASEGISTAIGLGP